MVIQSELRDLICRNWSFVAVVCVDFEGNFLENSSLRAGAAHETDLDGW